MEIIESVVSLVEGVGNEKQKKQKKKKGNGERDYSVIDFEGKCSTTTIIKHTYKIFIFINY